MGLSWLWSYGSWIYNYLCNQCLSPLMLWVPILIWTRCTTLCDKICQWLATGRWFSPDPPVSSTNRTDHQDRIEILLKVALTPSNKQTNKQTNKQINALCIFPPGSICVHVIVAKDILSLSKYKLFLLSILSFEKVKLFVDFSNIYGV